MFEFTIHDGLLLSECSLFRFITSWSSDTDVFSAIYLQSHLTFCTKFSAYVAAIYYYPVFHVLRSLRMRQFFEDNLTTTSLSRLFAERRC